MNEDLRTWWGFRVRTHRPRDFGPVTRFESFVFWLILAGLALVGWAAFLALSGEPAPASRWTPLRREALVPGGIVVVAGLLGLLLPGYVLEKARVGPWLALSREKGSLRSWDLGILIVAAVFLGLGLFRLGKPLWFTSALLVATVGAIHALLAFLQERLDFTRRKWRFELPDWLRPRNLEGQEKREGEDEGILAPDPDAERLFTVSIGDSEHSVGIRIPGDLLHALRELNAAHRGVFYQKAPATVVLMDREPVPDPADDHMTRFCGQVGSIARRHGLTRFQIANLVLALVQEGIQYRHDGDSTKQFPGGPYREYGRFPLETIHDGVGDCECTSLLCTSILSYLGFDAALILVTIRDPETGETTHHLASGVSAEDVGVDADAASGALDSVATEEAEGRRYLYGETAVDGMRIAFGTIPAPWRDGMKVEKVERIRRGDA